MFLLNILRILSSNGSLDNRLNGDGILSLESDDSNGVASVTGLVSLKYNETYNAYYLSPFLLQWV